MSTSRIPETTDATKGNLRKPPCTYPRQEPWCMMVSRERGGVFEARPHEPPGLSFLYGCRLPPQTVTTRMLNVANNKDGVNCGLIHRDTRGWRTLHAYLKSSLHQTTQIALRVVATWVELPAHNGAAGYGDRFSDHHRSAEGVHEVAANWIKTRWPTGSPSARASLKGEPPPRSKAPWR
jgi:hypothetical protein